MHIIFAHFIQLINIRIDAIINLFNELILLFIIF